MKKKDKFSVFYFWILITAILISQFLFFPDKPANAKLTYNQFIQAVDSGKIARLVVFEDKIIGEYKTISDTTEHKLTHAPTAPWRIRIPSIEKQVAKQFIVSRIPNFSDDELFEKLKSDNIDFEGNFESNGLRNFFLNWILPLVFFFVLWGLLSKKMGNNPMLDLGKNKAKIQAENPDNQVKFSDVAGVDEAVEEVKSWSIF